MSTKEATIITVTDAECRVRIQRSRRVVTVDGHSLATARVLHLGDRVVVSERPNDPYCRIVAIVSGY